MKSVYRAAALVAEFLAAFLPCIGCTSKHNPDNAEPPKPPTIRWRGPGTGYEGQADKPTEAPCEH